MYQKYLLKRTVNISASVLAVGSNSVSMSDLDCPVTLSETVFFSENCGDACVSTVKATNWNEVNN